MEGNGKTIPLFGSLSERNGMEHSVLPIPSKPPKFHSLQNWEEYEGMDLGLMNFHQKSP